MSPIPELIRENMERKQVDGNLVDGTIVKGSLISTWKTQKVGLYDLWNIASGRTLPFNIL